MVDELLHNPVGGQLGFEAVRGDGRKQVCRKYSRATMTPTQAFFRVLFVGGLQVIVRQRGTLRLLPSKVIPGLMGLRVSGYHVCDLVQSMQIRKVLTGFERQSIAVVAESGDHVGRRFKWTERVSRHICRCLRVNGISRVISFFPGQLQWLGRSTDLGMMHEGQLNLLVVPTGSSVR